MLDGTRQRLLVYHVVMASRKPKGIADDIVGGVRKIVSPWLGTPPGQNRSVTQAQGLARQAAEGLDQAFTGGMIKAGTQGNKALVKQAAVNAAALGAGYVAGKAVQKVLPLVQSRIGKELGVHLSDTDKLRNITFSPKRAGAGFDYGDVKKSGTYKFSPYTQRDLDSKGKLLPGYKVDSPKEFAETIANQNLGMAVKAELPTKGFAYITKSKQGEFDPDFGVFSPARIVNKQKVVGKVPLPQIGTDPEKIYTKVEMRQNFDAVTKVINDALLKRERITQSNLRSTLNTVRGVAGVVAQQTGTKKIKRR